MQKIQGLRADFIPHRFWPQRQWFYASSRYYHGPRREPTSFNNERFYKWVDPDLRSLCRLLHKSGLHTTPSCQGHFHNRNRFRRAWQIMSKELKKIVKGGLVVMNSETEQQLIFHDPTYHLPWRNFSSFYEQAAMQQNIGYLGILIPPERKEVIGALQEESRREALFSSEFDQTGRRLWGNLLFDVYVRTPDAQTQSQIWNEITHRIRKILVGNEYFQLA